MNPDTIAYIAGTGWLGGRLLTILLETTGHAAYTIRQTKTLKKLRTKRSRTSKKNFSMNIPNRFSPSKDFNKKTGAYFSLNETNTIVPAVRVRPNQTLIGLVQEFDSLRQNTALMLETVPVPPYAIKRNKPLKKVQGAYFADDLLLMAEPLSSYWQLARSNTNVQVGKSEPISLFKRIRKNFNGIILLLEPFMVGYFIYLAVKFERTEPLILAFGMTLFSLIFYIWADRHHNFLQKARLIFLAPMISWFMYLLSLTRLFALIKTIASKVRADWNVWKPQHPPKEEA